MQCSQLTFVCIIYIYIYICTYNYICPSHINGVGAVSLVSSPYYEPHSTGLTMRQSRRDCDESRNGAGQGRVVLVRLGGDRRMKKIMREPKWSGSSLSVIVLESDNGNKGTLREKAKKKESDRLRKK